MAARWISNGVVPRYPGCLSSCSTGTRLTGFYTRLIKAKPGWREHPLAHHPVYEEAYCLEGDFDYNFGLMTPGQYFFRPAGVRHGDFTAGEKGRLYLDSSL